jgi:rhodanese-related sulfurtransferase
MISLRDRLRKAKGEIASISADDAQALLGTKNVLFLDVRDLHEVQHDGTIPGAVHVPRGSLEFAVDPTSRAYNQTIKPELDIVVFCASGMRSLLSAQTICEMGYVRIKNIDGGFVAWRNIGAPVTKFDV